MIRSEEKEAKTGRTHHRVSVRQIELFDFIVHLVDPALQEGSVVLFESFVPSGGVVEFEVEGGDFVVEDLGEASRRGGDGGEVSLEFELERLRKVERER